MTPQVYTDPLAERIASGPLIEEARVDGELVRTRHYDANGLLVREQFPKGNALRYVGAAIVKSVDADTGVVAFTGLIPEEMPARILRTDDEYTGAVDPEDRSRFQLTSKTNARNFTPGATVNVGVYQPFITRYSYPTNRVMKERFWEDGTLFESTTYRYDRHGLISIHQTDHQTDTTRLLATFEYDERGNLTRERNPYIQFVSGPLDYVYHYDQAGRLTRISSENSSRETVITYAQTGPDTTSIELSTSSSITTITHDRSSNTVEFATTDHIRVNPLRSYELDHVLTSLGIRTPRHHRYAGSERFSSGRITLDEQNRILTQSAYEHPLRDTDPGVWWEITTTYGPHHHESTTNATRTEPANQPNPFPPPTTLTLTYSPPID